MEVLPFLVGTARLSQWKAASIADDVTAAASTV